MKKLICLGLLLLSACFASAQVNENIFPGWSMTAINNAFVANTSMYVYFPGTTSYVANSNTTYPRFQLSFMAPGTYTIDALSLWQLSPGGSFIAGTPIINTYSVNIGGHACSATTKCTVVVPSGTSQTNAFPFLTDEVLQGGNPVQMDVGHNWMLAVYFDSPQPSGAAVAQGIGAEVTGGINQGIGGDQVTGRTTLPYSRDGSNRIFLVTGVQAN